VAGLTLASVPAEVQERAKLLLADITGIIIRARHESESTPPLLETVRKLGLAEGRFHVLGDSGTYSASGAALVNAACGHSIELDDHHAIAHTHNASVVVPAALAAAEMANASGETLLLAVIAGLEVCCRVGLGTHYRDLRGHGFWMPPTAGAFGATAAAARALGLTADQTEQAFGLALSESAGSGQFLFTGAWSKRFQMGNAGMAGVVAASLAQQDYSGANEALEGERGFFQMFSPSKPNADRAVAGLGEQWEILEIAFKPHASCRSSHSHVDAAIALRNQYGLTLADVDHIDVHLYHSALVEVGLPQEVKRSPRTLVDAQFSVHFAIAVALKLGRQGWDDYRTELDDPEIRDVMQRTNAAHSEKAESHYPAYMAGGITIHTKDGRVLDQFTPIPLGDPANMLEPEAIRGKFTSLVLPFLGEQGARDLLDLLLNVEKAPRVERVFQLATPAVLTSA
jgi:2-methylcitrate dehydratase PrpD